MRQIRTNAAFLLASMLVLALLGGIATARPAAPVAGEASAKGTSPGPNTARSRHPVGMPYFSFQPRS